MLASLHELAKQNTVHTGHSFCKITKKLAEVYRFKLGWKRSPIINKQDRRGGSKNNAPGGKKLKT